MEHLTTIHEYDTAPLYLAKSGPELIVLQNGVVYDIEKKELAASPKIFPFGDDYSLGTFPQAPYALLEGPQIKFSGRLIDIPRNAMVFGFLVYDEKHYCACQIGLIELESGKLLEFEENALSCDYQGNTLLIGLENEVEVVELQKGAINNVLELSTSSPVVEVRIDKDIMAFKCANNSFECYRIQPQTLLLREEFTRRITSMCCISDTLFIANNVGEIIVFRM